MDDYYKSIKKRNRILVGIIVFILIFVALLTYKVFVVDKKKDTQIGTKTEEKKVGKEDVSIESVEVKKYYDYITSNGQVKGFPYVIDEKLDYILNNKNLFAYTRIVRNENSITKKCADYATYIDSISADKKYTCFNPTVGVESCNSNTKQNTTTNIYVVEGSKIKNAVEMLFGKDSYSAESFDMGGGIVYHYYQDNDEYIWLNTCRESDINKMYETKLYKAEKDENNLYIYENVKYDDQELMNIKHIFEKNKDNNEYHYVKSEKAISDSKSNDNRHITSDVIKLGTKTYIEQLTKVKIENTDDYLMITKKVNLSIPEHEEGTTISFSIPINYTFHVNGKDYDGTYILDGNSENTIDENSKYKLTVTNLTKNYDIEVLVETK